MASTIKDVARLAGVGVGTASRVISGRGPVSAETAAKVQQAIAELEFRPSSIARALSRQSLDMLGIYVPSYGGGLFYATALETVDQQLRAVGRHMVAANGCGDSNPRQKALDGIDFLRQRECDGLILMTHELTDDDLRQLHAGQPHIAVLNRLVPGLEAVCFCCDHEQGGRLAAELLLAQGHRRIALISGPHDALDNEARLRGFRAVLDEAGIEIDPQAVTDGDFTFEGGLRCSATLIARRPALGFTALFAANDLMAMAAISAFSRAGLRVPQDVSVMGYDDCEIAPYTWPPLSSVRIPLQDMAKQATRDLLNRCYDLDLSVERTFTPTLVQRESVQRLDQPVRA